MNTPMTLNFRAWSTIQKNFYYFSLPDKGWETTTRELADREIQQSTGLMDHQGREIYEHDILQVTGEFCEGRGNIIEVLRSVREAGFIEGIGGGILSKDSIEDGELTVIGNRFEGYKSIVRRTEDGNR